MTDTENRFISYKAVPQEDKKAMGNTISALAIIVAGREDVMPPVFKDWLDGKVALSGSIKENMYRDFINSVRREIRNGRPIATHPYFAPNIRLLDIVKPSSRLERFYADTNAPAVFDMDEYIKLTCDINSDGKIKGLKQSVLNGEDSQKENLNQAFSTFFGKVGTYSLGLQK